MGTGGLILWHYLGGLCCLLSTATIAGMLIFAGKRKKDESRARSLEIREPSVEEPHTPGADRHVDPGGDTS